MIDSDVICINDLKHFRSAPNLNSSQSQTLFKELSSYIDNADWLTIGVMAPSSKRAIFILKEMETLFKWPALNLNRQPVEDGPVFLKANQKTGDVYIRIEYGLGEGILLSCQYNEEDKNAETIGPFPLDFFQIIDKT